MEIPEFGRGGGKDTSDQESHMKGWAVLPAKTSQKREDSIFTEQLCMRYGEANVLARICRSNAIYDAVDNESPIVQQYWGRGRLELELCQDGTFQVKNKSNRQVPIDPVVIEYFREVYGDRWDRKEEHPPLAPTSILLFTEVGMKQGYLIRAHPNYNGEGSWYDCIKCLRRKTRIPNPENRGNLP